ncbi:MAG: hypothetical protein NTV22_12025 [bacterium]|nr:hypothetical protein [bacterium]
MKTLDAWTSAASAICLKDTGRSGLAVVSAYEAARTSPRETKLIRKTEHV